jgi:ornithine carbamoyltransferase
MGNQKHFLKLLDYKPEEIRELLDLAILLKKEKRDGVERKRLSGKTLL